MTPTLIVVAGPNGSGKTTFATTYQAETGGILLSTDLIADDLRRAGTPVSEFNAGRRFFAKLNRLLEDGQNLIVESTVAGRGLTKHIDRARALGYQTSIVFIFLESADMCVARVEERVRKGGHRVAEEDIRRRYPLSIKHFWDLHRLAFQRWYLFYNSGSQFAAVAAGTGPETSIFDDALFAQFQSIVEGVSE